MKAAYIERHGGPEVLQYGDLPDPVAGAGEVVVPLEQRPPGRIGKGAHDGIDGGGFDHENQLA